MKIYILHLRQDNIVTHIGHHGCVYDIISSNVLKGTQSNTELGNIHNTGNTLQYNTIQYNTIQCIYRTVQRILFVPIYRLSDEKVAALSQFSFLSWSSFTSQASP